MSKWKTVKLGEVGVIITGNTPKTSDKENYLTNNISFYKPSDIVENNVSYLNSSEAYVSEVARSKVRMLPKGSILVTCIGIIGKIGILEHEATFNQQINAIIPNQDICLNRYIAYSIFFNRDRLRDIANAPVVPIVNKTQFSNMIIPLPPLEEQKHIADILDKASNLIDLRKQQLEKMDLLVKSKFIDMFGDPVTNPNEWQLVPLMETGSCKNGMNFRSNEFGVEIHCLGVGDFKDLSVIEDTYNLLTISLNEMPTSEYLLQDGDIVFVRSNGNKALVGRCLAIYPGRIPTTYSGFCIRYRKSVDNISTKYLLQVFKAPSMRKQIAGRGANIQNLNQQILSQINIPVPPIELQNQFTSFVEQIEKQKAVMQKSLEKMGTNYKALMQEYF